MENSNNIAIIGAGNLGLAIADGLRNAGYLGNGMLYLTRRNTGDIASWASETTVVTSNNRDAVANVTVVILCVQPHQVEGVLREVNPVLRKDDHVLISVITAVSLDQLESYAGGAYPIIRAMPNTAIAVQQSMTCMAHNGVSKKIRQEAESIFSCVGKTLWIEEPLMQAATVV